MRVASIYLPNGNPVDSPKFPYKLAWMERLYDHARALLEYQEAFVLGGDYNIAPTDADVYDPAALADDALCQPDSRARFRAILHLGLTEAYRALHSQAGPTASGTTRRAAGSATKACASTTCCSRPRPPTGWRPATSTRRRAAVKKPRTTRRCGAS